MSGEALRIALRADASVHLGLGHIKRCLSFGQAAAACGARVRLVARRLGVDLESLALAAGVEYTEFGAASDGESWQFDAERTVAALADWRPHWVVVDNYALAADWHRQVAARLQARICMIDDLANRNLHADVLLDQNPSVDHRKKYLGHLNDGVTLLGGPRFALLSPSYVNAPRVKVKPVVESIGIFMGGTDARNLSRIALRACREHAGFRGTIEVATTRANPYLESLRSLAARLGPTRVTVDLADLAEFFARHDLQIGAGGGATWERCAVGAPTIGMLVAENQRMVLPMLAEQGAIRFFESTSDDVPRELGDVIRNTIDSESLRADLATKARALVDGNGARRLAVHLHADFLWLRAATTDDAVLMLAWRNHAVTREFSLDSKEIGYEEHRRWLENVLRDEARPVFLAMAGRCEVGVIRFDVSEEVANVSLYLDPDLHGLGLGKRMLAAAEAHVASRMTVRAFTARVLAKNAVSRKLFESAGYRFEGELARKSTAVPE